MSNLSWLPSETDALAHAANIYIDNGWSIFPCFGKTPIAGHGFKDATTDLITVTGWWGTNPHYNVAWALPAGWMALDVDAGKNGFESLRQLEAKHGPLPLTLRQVTGSGGEHWIYRVPNGVDIRQGAGFMPGLDTRVGGKGYIMVAPSIHPVTRKPYRWHTAIEPVAMPSWLIELTRKQEPKPVGVVNLPRRDVFANSANSRQRHALAKLDGLAKFVSESARGTRNDRLNWAWFKARDLFDVIAVEDARAVLRDAALKIELDEREIAKVLR